ncbi:MAG: efflux RND transporter periplasmic adaptor subunit [Acidobacteria bacterium]|nr:efflux RND transporter periplasmic adaptor subunit [Acidobacteriota bacterium]
MNLESRSRWRRVGVGLGLLVLLTGAGFYFWKWKGSGGQAAAGKAGSEQAGKDTYYCPMHPSYKSDKPDNCPVCSMKLVKLETAPGTQGKPGHEHAMGGMEPNPAASNGTGSPTGNSFFISPQRQQMIGVQTVLVDVVPLTKEIRAVGKVAFDETKITHIHTKVTGYIEEVFVDFMGQVVKQGDPLFTIYSPDLVSTQEEYLLALRSRNTLKNSSFEWVSTGSQNLLEAARQRLRLWDIREEDIQRLEKEGKVRRTLTIYSPVNGLVTERAAFHHGKFVSPEMDLYKLVDLSTVWILGDIYEYELPYVKSGQLVEIEFPYASETKSLRGNVTYLYPYLDPKTRTAQVRMEFPNPGFQLKPDMFVNLKLKVSLGPSLAVPEDAVLDTGSEQYVFVDKGEGYLEPRPVKVGGEAMGYVAIQSGLSAGERVVTAANFILDSESRLKGAFANMGMPDPKQISSATGAAPNLKVEIMEPKVAKLGQNSIRLMVRDAAGNPITDADVDVSLFMPQMGSMAPMTSKASLRPTKPGEYQGEVDVPMAWTWQTTVSVKKGGKPMGSAQTTLTAR